MTERMERVSLAKLPKRAPLRREPHANRSLPTALPLARQALREMSASLEAMAQTLDDRFDQVVSELLRREGHTHVTGIGKSFLVAQKVAATFSSVGTPASALHATEAVHGDIGRVNAGDVVLVLSHSGQTAEVVRLAHLLGKADAWVVAITGNADSALSRASQTTLCYGPLRECEPLRLVPTASAVAMMAMGDALALACLSRREDAKAIYAQRHPAGALGQHLQTVQERMRHAAALPVAAETSSVGEVVRIMTETEGRPGAACLIDAAGRLTGLFTDGDLRRLVLTGPIAHADCIRDHMHHAPLSIEGRLSVAEAAALLLTHRIDQLPVVDAEGRPVGLLDIQDVVSPWGG